MLVFNLVAPHLGIFRRCHGQDDLREPRCAWLYQFKFHLHVQILALFNGLSTVMPSVALLYSEAVLRKQVP